MTIGIFTLLAPEQSNELSLFTEAADKLGIDVKFYRPSDICIRIMENKLYVLDRRNTPLAIDGVVNWIPSTCCDEIFMAIKNMNIPYINTEHTVRCCRNKMLTGLLLQQNGIRQPDTSYFPKMGRQESIQVSLPSVYKKKKSAHGTDAAKLNDHKELLSFLTSKGKQNNLYFQKYLNNFGFDYRVMIVGNNIVGTLKNTYADGEWRTPINHGGKAESVKTPPRLGALALRSAKAVGADFAGVDILPATNGSYHVLEVNSTPDMSFFYEQTGINPAQEILKHLEDKINDCWLKKERLI